MPAAAPTAGVSGAATPEPIAAPAVAPVPVEPPPLDPETSPLVIPTTIPIVSPTSDAPVAEPSAGDSSAGDSTAGDTSGEAPALDISKIPLPLLPLPDPFDPRRLTRHAADWDLVMESERAVGLVPLDRGVLARIDGASHVIGPDGALVAKPEVDAKPSMLAGEVFGAWPDDAWRLDSVQNGRLSADHAFYKWRGNNRWVRQKAGEHDKVSPEWMSFRSVRGGIVVVLPGSDFDFVRAAGKYPAPESLEIGEMVRDVAAFEADDGTIFLFAWAYDDGDPRGLMIFHGCKRPAPGCARSGGVALPGVPGTRHSPREMVARRRGALTVAIEESVDGQPSGRQYLVHHEARGWKAEGLAYGQKVERLLPGPDGGVWIELLDVAGASLVHRSETGEWLGFDLPEAASGATKLDLALSGDGELWLAFNVGEHHAFYRRPATLVGAAGQ